MKNQKWFSTMTVIGLKNVKIMFQYDLYRKIKLGRDWWKEVLRKTVASFLETRKQTKKRSWLWGGEDPYKSSSLASVQFLVHNNSGHNTPTVAGGAPRKNEFAVWFVCLYLIVCSNLLYFFVFLLIAFFYACIISWFIEIWRTGSLCYFSLNLGYHYFLIILTDWDICNSRSVNCLLCSRIWSKVLCCYSNTVMRR